MPIGRKFGRKKGQRRAFIKALMHNLIMAGKMRTTIARAKEARGRFDRLVSIAKQQNVAALRRLQSVLPKRSARKLYYELTPRLQSRRSGYSRILRGFSRKRDGADMVVLEIIHDAAA